MVVISATGLYTPSHSVSNEALVTAFNAYVERFNLENSAAISAGDITPLQPSSVEFIEKASGIKSRFFVAPDGIVDPEVMAPRMTERRDDEPGILAEIAVKAARQALETAGRDARDVDCIIVACSNLQRPYPAVAIEVQQLLGAGGYAFDMNVACSSATFGIKTASDAIRAGTAQSILVVNPEICSGHLDFRDRDSHFIFGDAATAILVESEARAGAGGIEVLDCRCITQFSNNIRNNFGFLNRTHPETQAAPDKLFKQQGRSVFKEVCPMVAELISGHARDLSLDPKQLKRLWLHQANLSMNQLIAKNVLGKDFDRAEAPVILDRYANTSSAGSIIAFHLYREDFQSGDHGVICSFGAGYSAGSVMVRGR